jgi:hypothetical protein
MTHPLASEKPELCAVCRRQAMPLGYRPMPGMPALWVCQDAECQRAARKVYGMSTEDLTHAEQVAAEAGGDAAGQWLDSISKTDLATLTREEWAEFLRLIIDGYQCKLRHMMAHDYIPY